MRIVFLIIVLLIAGTVHSQPQLERALDSLVVQFKMDTEIDSKDERVFSLLEQFYDEVLQADNSALSAKTIKKVKQYSSDRHLKNSHLFILFFMYQQLVTDAAETGGNPNAATQLAYINKLETEMRAVYGKVPVIVLIYKTESLESAGQKEEAKSFVEESLKKYPDSVPLKVYRYLATRDENLKADLVQNHSKHWLVKHNRIGL